MTNPARLLRISDVMERTSLSRSQIYALIKRSRFPAQRRLGAKCSRWVESEIERWIQNMDEAA